MRTYLCVKAACSWLSPSLTPCAFLLVCMHFVRRRDKSPVLRKLSPQIRHCRSGSRYAERDGSAFPLCTIYIAFCSRSTEPARHNQFDFSVAIVVAMSFFVPTFVLAVVFVPATVVPIAVMVPVMVVLETSART